MSTMQLQKTRNAETFTKTAIDQKQSLEVVQTMLHGGLSSLSYLRNFFAEKAFDEHVYEMSENIRSYHDYASGKLTTNLKKASLPSTLMKVLRRGRSKRVDMFLGWLENGAFPALAANNLRALQVYVHTDPYHRENVIETYTFTIKYVDGNNGQKIAGLELDSQGHSLISIGATNSALQYLLRKVMDLCQALPDLPDKRYISMALFYNHDTQDSHQPKGFVPSSVDKLLFADAEGWGRRSEILEELRSGFHCTTLSVSHSQRNGYTYVHGLNPPALPDAIQYNVPVSPAEEMGTAQAGDRVVEISNEPVVEDDRPATTTPSIVIDSEHFHAGTQLTQILETKKPVITPAPTSKPSGNPFLDHDPQLGSSAQENATATMRTMTNASQVHDSIGTQSSNIPGMMKALKGMMLPVNMTQGDTQPQDNPYASRPCSESTESPTRSGSYLLTTVVGTKPALLQSVAQKLDRAKPNLRQTARQLAKLSGSKKTTDVILCQCSYSKEEGAMVACTYCDTWQHLHCYGYTSDEDPRLPTDHVCYQCLLGGREEDVLKELKDLAQKRRGMYFALQTGLKTQRDFAANLGMGLSIAAPLYRHLKHEGYVAAACDSRRASSTASGKLQFVAIKEGPAHERMLNNFFDPMMHISNHYELPANFVTQRPSLTKRLLATQRNSMPHPATPASRLKKKAAQTPASGLDLRASMTPFETPSRSHSRQTQPQKRARDYGEGIDSPPKRRKTPTSTVEHLTSVQTECMLDAAGLSSSPTDSGRGY